MSMGFSLHGPPNFKGKQTKSRLRVLSLYLLVFATGCGLTAYLYTLGHQDVYQANGIISVSDIRSTGKVRVMTGLSRGATSVFIELGPNRDKEKEKEKELTFPRLVNGSIITTGSLVDGLPPDFDWKAYLLWNPDVRLASIRTKESAILHFKSHGMDEGRWHKPIPILLRYTACQGLFNQMYAHVSAFVLAGMLGADVVLPPSVYRDSFNRVFSTDTNKNQVQWSAGPPDLLLDVPAVQDYFSQRGMRVYTTPSNWSRPDCTKPYNAFPNYTQPEISPDQVVQFPNVYLQSMHIWYIWDKAAEVVVKKHTELQQLGYPAFTPIVLDLPCPFLSIMTLTCLEEASFAAAGLQFNPSIVEIAQSIVQKMQRAGARTFNGAHLRLEKDAGDWARILGGMDMYLNEYRKAFSAAGFNRSRHLYVASGLLSYNASKEMLDLMQFLHPYSKVVHYKEKYVKPEILRGLNPEQQALLDFLVLSHSDMFVGLGSSTFSVYLREYRALFGLSRTRNIFIDSRRIGTDPLFERCTHFAPLD